MDRHLRFQGGQTFPDFKGHCELGGQVVNFRFNLAAIAERKGRMSKSHFKRHFSEIARAKNRKPDDIPLHIDFFHHSIITCFPKIPFFFFEEDSQEISFGIVPDLYDISSH